MKDAFFDIENLDTYFVVGILVFFGILEVVAGYLHRSKRTGSDWIQEVGSFVLVGSGDKACNCIGGFGFGTKKAKNICGVNADSAKINPSAMVRIMVQNTSHYFLKPNEVARYVCAIAKQRKQDLSVMIHTY